MEIRLSSMKFLEKWVLLIKLHVLQVQYNISFLDKVKVKGRDRFISVYEIFDADFDEIKELKIKTKTDFEIGQNFFLMINILKQLNAFMQFLKPFLMILRLNFSWSDLKMQPMIKYYNAQSH